MAAQNGTNRGAWLVIAIVILGVAAVTMVSSRRGFGAVGADRPRVLAVMGSTRHQYAVDAQPFTGADATAVMGSCSLDLSRARMSAGQEAVVDIFAMMGSVTIRVPREWTIDTRAIPVMGGLRDSRSMARRPDEASAAPGEPPRLVLRGVVMMGSLIIRS
jgi:predicted membrane protein